MRTQSQILANVPPSPEDLPNYLRREIQTIRDEINLAFQGATMVVATASLPAAGTAQDGRVLIEDHGAGDRNLVIYAGGQRFRVDGGASF